MPPAFQKNRDLRPVSTRAWNWPDESPDFSYADVFDVAEFLADAFNADSAFPGDLPPFLVQALQHGPRRVPPGTTIEFYRRQRECARIQSRWAEQHNVG